MTEPRPDSTPDQGVDAESETDTEGHSLLGAEYGRQVARERTREADDWARHEALGKAAHAGQPKGRSLRDRLRGR
jgi:hypothetical protein